MSYINIILTACIFFPILAFFITLPYIIYNYNKYGSVLFVRTFLIYGFVLYLLSAYFLVILPLPDIKDVVNMKIGVQLIPFNFVKEIIENSCFNIKDISTYIKFLKEPWVYQALYNLLLTMPFAIFLRYYFNYNFKKTIMFTFLLSLFFELTQLTGLYFIYPNSYRLFDIDDLIVNTLGGIVGYLITPLIKKILPNKKELDTKAYIKGSKVSTTKRIITFLIDTVIVIFILLLIELLSIPNNSDPNLIIDLIIVTFLIFIIIPIIFKTTLGGMITNIKIASKLDSNVKWYQILFRNLLLIYVVIPMFYYLKMLFEYINMISHNDYNLIIMVAYPLIILIWGIFIIIRNFILHKPFLYEKLSRTQIISTIKVPNQDSGDDC